MRPEIVRIQELMEKQGYVTDAPVATAVHLAIALGKPLLVEGYAGVGKTEVAKTLAAALDTRLIRLQCYEGIDAASALYEWNYAKQLLHIRLAEHEGRSIGQREAEIFSRAFLLERPLLQAITAEVRPVLLIDEVDRSDEEFEAFLLEVLSDFQVTIPEIGTVHARERPCVVLTSNRARDLSDALRRRCLYLWIGHPALDKELRIVRTRLPGIGERLAREVAVFMQSVRQLRLAKRPGTAETLDWAAALLALHVETLDEDIVRETTGCFLKEEADHRALDAELDNGRFSAMVSP